VIFLLFVPVCMYTGLKAVRSRFSKAGGEAVRIDMARELLFYRYGTGNLIFPCWHINYYLLLD